MNFQNFLKTTLTGITAGLALIACTSTAAPTPAEATAPAPVPTTLPATPTTQAEPTLQPTPTRLPHMQLLPEGLDGTRIHFWHPWSGEMADLLWESTQEFNRVNSWGIQVEITAPGGSGLLFEQVSEQLTEQTAPNVVAASMDQILTWHRQAGVVINLNDYVDDSIWGLNPQERADFPRAFWDQGEVDGRRFSLPAMRSPEVLFYNAGWARSLGFARPPSNIDEFEAQACAAATANQADADRANDGTGGWIVNTDPLVQLSWLYSFGFPGFEDGESIRFDRGSTRQMFTFFRDLYDRGCVWTARLTEPYEYFSNRRALFYSGTLYDLPTQELVDQRFNNEDEWTILPYPASSAGKPVVLTSGLSYAVLASEAEEQMASWLFIRWLTLGRIQAPLAEASGAWPASTDAIAQMSTYRAENPVWDQSLLWIPIAQPAPVHPEWRLARNVLADATWQLYQTNITPEDIPNLLSILDATVADVLENAP